MSDKDSLDALLTKAKRDSSAVEARLSLARDAVNKKKWVRAMPWLIGLAILALIVMAIVIVPSTVARLVNSIRSQVQSGVSQFSEELATSLPSASTSTVEPTACQYVEVQQTDQGINIKPMPVINQNSSRWCFESTSLQIWAEKVAGSDSTRQYLTSNILTSASLGEEYRGLIDQAIMDSSQTGILILPGLNAMLMPVITATPVVAEPTITAEPIATEVVVVIPTVTSPPPPTATSALPARWKVEDLQQFFDSYGGAVTNLSSNAVECKNFDPRFVRLSGGGVEIIVDLSGFEVNREVTPLGKCLVGIYDEKPSGKDIQSMLMPVGQVWLYPYSQK